MLMLTRLKTVYDSFGELLSSADTLVQATTSAYDAVGRPESRIDGLRGP
jgi:YD repeat-containing protein